MSPNALNPRTVNETVIDSLLCITIGTAIRINVPPVLQGIPYLDSTEDNGPKKIILEVLRNGITYLRLMVF